MRKMLKYAFVIALAVSCSKDEKQSTSMNITGIKSAEVSQIVNINLKSGEETSSNIACYYMGSTLIDSQTGGYGYVDCNSVYNEIDPLTGNNIKSFSLPNAISQTVIIPEKNILIGQYYEDEHAINHVVQINLEDGSIVSNNTFPMHQGFLTCSYFYNQEKKAYELLRSDGYLMSINPDNGNIMDSVYIGAMLSNTQFDSDNKRLIGLTYSFETDKNYIEAYHIETGALLSKVEITTRSNYFGCVSGYDTETDSFILVDESNTVLFIDITSGKINDSYQINNSIFEFKFWRKG